MTDKRRVRLGTASRDVVSLGGGAFEIDGTRWTATSDGPGAWRLRADGKPGGRVFVAGPPASPWIFYDGRVYHLEVTAADMPARQSRDAAGELSAPMPATVRAVLVAAGDHVTVGQPLVILEAMKMELPLRAPVEGTVQSVRCAPGDLVQPGTPLVEVA
jgi:acetyl/propionyl-CoA carboxylase alpha subunit